ncbi:MAG: hypothetical protein E7411_06430 [Ruminococcaceae bacterium]|nr:hypothetical protein [Oscillospiraceae bacterium]
MKNKGRLITAVAVYVTLIASVVFSIYKIITSSSVTDEAAAHVRSDYVLMLLQCILGIVVLGVPAFLEKKFSFEMPNAMAIAYFVFLYCAIYLGEVRQFYYLIPHWDDVLHCFSAGMLGAFGFSLVDILNKSEKIKMNLNPYFVSLFAFSFALSIGALWEIYEFSGDCFFGLNMQKYRLENGSLLTGNAALSDTMHDIIIDAVGALTVSVSGLLGNIHRKKQ